MSVTMSVTTPEGYRSRRVGTNCAQFTMMALWLAAYAIANKPESARVRSRWIEPQRITSPYITPVEWPIPFQEWALVRGVKALLAYNKDDSAWIQMNEDTIKRGLALKPPVDASLKALVDLYGYACHNPCPQDVPAGSAARIAPVLAELLPLLKESCWYDQMNEYSNIFATAVKYGVGVNIG